MGTGGAENLAGSDPGGMGGQDDTHIPSPLSTTSLVVAGGAVGLTPAFSPAIHRYSIRASDPAGPVEVTVTADESSKIFVAGRPTKSGVPIRLDDVSPDDTLDIRVETHGGASEHFEIVYLPSDFPDLVVTTLTPDASTDPIYVGLWGANSFVAKLDNHGVPLFYRREAQPVMDFKRHKNGRMSYASAGDRILLGSEYGEVARIELIGADSPNHHEFRILDNGNYVGLVYKLADRDLTDFGGAADAQVLDSILREVNHDGELLFEWNSWDHMRYDESLSLDVDTTDYAHVNSLDIDADGNWLVSSQRQSQLLKVDRQTGTVMWRLGGVANEFTFINDPYAGPCGQHYAYWSSSSRILLFDNGHLCYPQLTERGNRTRIVEYEIDEVARTATLVWSYSEQGVFSNALGSAQRLKNGNTFIGWGARSNRLASEVDTDGNVVFEIEARLPAPNVTRSYRALRFPE